MSMQYIPRSMPSLNVDTYTEARNVIQQFTTLTNEVEAMFTVETINEGTEILLKTFGSSGMMIPLRLSYETANALQLALSDALDTLEGVIDLDEVIYL